MTDHAHRDETSILSWYDARAPRILDLVGDYAGKELFLVEGDSLLRACFEDDRVDFDGELLPTHYPALAPPLCRARAFLARPPSPRPPPASALLGLPSQGPGGGGVHTLGLREWPDWCHGVAGQCMTLPPLPLRLGSGGYMTSSPP